MTSHLLRHLHLESLLDVSYILNDKHYFALACWSLIVLTLTTTCFWFLDNRCLKIIFTQSVTIHHLSMNDFNMWLLNEKTEPLHSFFRSPENPAIYWERIWAYQSLPLNYNCKRNQRNTFTIYVYFDKIDLF